MYTYHLISNTTKASAIIALFVAISPVFADNDNQSSEEKYREDTMQTIVDVWRNTDETTASRLWQQGIKHQLQRLSSEDLDAALNAATYEEVTTIIETAVSATVDFDSPYAVAGKLYYALSPFRLVDTRSATGIYAGPVSSGTS